VKDGHDVRWLEPDRGRSRRRRRAVTRTPDARQLAAALVGSTIYTLDQRKPNEVQRIDGGDVIVGTGTSPTGSPVALRKIQDGLDILFSAGEVRITPATFGGYRRSSFIGAFLGTLDGVVTTERPVWVRLADGAGARADVTAIRGYPEPEVGRAVDAAGTRIALKAIKQRFPGLEVEAMPHTNPGFDVRVLDADGVAVAYVEIKSTATTQPVFFLSERERQFAKLHAARFHLVVVTCVNVRAGTGEVQWRKGALDGAGVELKPRQWVGRLAD
jgi:uncharacterized protein DUF3883